MWVFPVQVHVAEAKGRKASQSSSSSKQDGGKKASSLVDPLSSALEGSDPLSQFAAAAAAKPKPDPLAIDPLSAALTSSSKDAVSL